METKEQKKSVSEIYRGDSDVFEELNVSHRSHVINDRELTEEYIN